ncbi:MAG TPA: DUF1559 domain-containing protein [Tepidisphaeraceae bacterium]|nr:DUF1559 domain-containing protein [Tepidisphaeraceae bacterium]
MFRKRIAGAFTLVELLVVIGIITILIGILLPVLNKARTSALETICMSNMRQLGVGVQNYANQFYGALPQKGPDGSNSATESFSPKGGVIGYDDPGIWFNAIPPLVSNKSYYDLLVEDANGAPLPHPGGNASIFICPLAGPAAEIGGHDIVFGDYYLLFGTDSTGSIKSSSGLSNSGEFKFNMSYVWNSKLATTTKYGNQLTLKITDCQPSSEVVIMTEKIANPGEYMDPTVQAWNKANPTVYLNTNKINAQGSNVNVAQSKADWTRFAARHRHGGHLLFADSHVQWFSWTDVQYPPDQLPYTPNSDANQPGKIIWSALGPVD